MQMVFNASRLSLSHILQKHMGSLLMLRPQHKQLRTNSQTGLGSAVGLLLPPWVKNEEKYCLPTAAAAKPDGMCPGRAREIWKSGQQEGFTDEEHDDRSR